MSERLGPMTAKGCVILDANGNPVGSTSRPEMSEAFAAAYNEVGILRNLCKELLKADKSDTSNLNDLKDVYLPWWAYDAVNAAARGESLAGTFADDRAQPLPARDQEHDGHDGHL